MSISAPKQNYVGTRKFVSSISTVRFYLTEWWKECVLNEYRNLLLYSGSSTVYCKVWGGIFITFLKKRLDENFKYSHYHHRSNCFHKFLYRLYPLLYCTVSRQSTSDETMRKTGLPLKNPFNLVHANWANAIILFTFKCLTINFSIHTSPENFPLMFLKSSPLTV